MIIKQIGRWIEDWLLATPRAIWGVWNAVTVQQLNVLDNWMTHMWNQIKKTAAYLHDAITYNPYDLDDFKKLAKEDGFGARTKKRFQNLWTWVTNTAKWSWNKVAKLFNTVKNTVLYVPPMLVGLAIGTPLKIARDEVKVLAWWIIDPLNAVLEVGNQWPNKTTYEFSNIASEKTVSYNDYLSKPRTTRAERKALKKAKRAEKRAAIAAINAKYDWKSLAPKQPEAKPETPPPAPDTEKTDGAKKK